MRCVSGARRLKARPRDPLAHHLGERNERGERAQETIGDQLFAALSDEERVTLRSLLNRAQLS